jgi:hypothetical protein
MRVHLNHLFFLRQFYFSFKKQTNTNNFFSQVRGFFYMIEDEGDFEGNDCCPISTARSK